MLKNQPKRNLSKVIENNFMYDVVVIGAGVVGSLIARKLSSYQLDIAVLEKEPDVGSGVTMANSAIVHSGYDPVPGSLKAKLNVLGNAMFDKLSEELDVEFERRGSLTVALYDSQLPLLKELAERSKVNGVPVQILSKEETLKLEPNLNPEVKGSLFAPTAGLINPFTLCAHATENAVDNGAKLFLNEKVIAISKSGDVFDIKCESGNIYQSKIIINAAGIYSEEIHRMVEPIDYKLTPRKGEYFILDHYSDSLVKHTIFPLPSEKGKGILVSPTTGGTYLVGPSAEVTFSKDDVSTDKLTLDEIKRQALDMVPSIPFNQVIRTFAGTRPTPSTHDFIIDYAKSDKHFITCSGIESPGLVSSPAIAEYVVNEYLSKIISLKEKKDYNPRVNKRTNLSKMSIKERQEFVSKHPEYGQIICNCEKVSLGEILEEFKSSVPPKSIKAVKVRTRAGFGKCQGGFCQPLVIQLIAKEFNIPLNKVLYEHNDSYIVRYKAKEDKND